MSTNRRRRATLSRDAVIEAALAVVAQDGLEALSMRRVADELNVAPMSLYRHVGDRNDMLVGMLDVVAEGMGPVEPMASPRAELEAIIMELHGAFHDHPWVVSVLTRDGLASAKVMPLMDQLFGCLFRAGLDETDAIRAWQLLFEVVVGEAMFIRSVAPTYGQLLFRASEPSELPNLGRLLEVGATTNDFRATLAVLLDAVL